jgi:hypothetical protein
MQIMHRNYEHITKIRQTFILRKLIWNFYYGKNGEKKKSINLTENNLLSIQST